jgi:DNA-binding NtrC family response regulator
MIVDDDYVVREELVRALRDDVDLLSLGAASVDAALAVLRNVDVDVLVVDLQLPGDGAQRLLSELPRSPGGERTLALGMSARGCPSEDEATAMGCSARLDKPFALEALSAAVAALLAPRSRRPS